MTSLYFAKFAFSEIVCYAFYRTYTSLLLAFRLFCMNIHAYAELLHIVICMTVCISYNSVKLTSHPQLCYNKKAETAFRHVSAI